MVHIVHLRLKHSLATMCLKHTILHDDIKTTLHLNQTTCKKCIKAWKKWSLK